MTQWAESLTTEKVIKLLINVQGIDNTIFRLLEKELSKRILNK